MYGWLCYSVARQTPLPSVGSGVKSSGPGRRCAGHAGWRSRAGDRCLIVCLWGGLGDGRYVMLCYVMLCYGRRERASTGEPKGLLQPGHPADTPTIVPQTPLSQSTPGVGLPHQRNPARYQQPALFALRTGDSPECTRGHTSARDRRSIVFRAALSALIRACGW